MRQSNLNYPIQSVFSFPHRCDDVYGVKENTMNGLVCK